MSFCTEHGPPQSNSTDTAVLSTSPTGASVSKRLLPILQGLLSDRKYRTGSARLIWQIFNLKMAVTTTRHRKGIAGYQTVAGHHRTMNRALQEWLVHPVSALGVRWWAPCDFTLSISSGHRPGAVRYVTIYCIQKWKSKGARSIYKILIKQLGLKIMRAHVKLWKPL